MHVRLGSDSDKHTSICWLSLPASTRSLLLQAVFPELPGVLVNVALGIVLDSLATNAEAAVAASPDKQHSLSGKVARSLQHARSKGQPLPVVLEHLCNVAGQLTLHTMPRAELAERLAAAISQLTQVWFSRERLLPGDRARPVLTVETIFEIVCCKLFAAHVCLNVIFQSEKNFLLTACLMDKPML